MNPGIFEDRTEKTIVIVCPAGWSVRVLADGADQDIKVMRQLVKGYTHCAEVTLIPEKVEIQVRQPR